MSHLTKRWLIAPRPTPEEEAKLIRVPPILREIVFNRNCRTYEEVRAFLEAHMPEGTEPENMLGVSQAADRICFAIERGEKIAVYGDYDVDGVTSTALLTQVLKAFHADVQGYIPNRFEEGYGVNIEALETLREDGVGLVITVDCGIRSLEEAEHARRLGMDMIISDHHHPSQEIPLALAVINPKQPGDAYPEKNLAGVGLAYKLAAALFERISLSLNGAAQLSDALDLVALGTVADMAPLRGENRALVRQGLRAIRHSQRQGLVSLINISRISQLRVTASDIGFILGPRLNAAGRLESALASLDLLTTDNRMVAGLLAQQLENQNRERQDITRQIQEQAEKMALEKDPQALLLFAAHPDFNSGVVGLAASRLMEHYYRPAIVAQQGETYTRGSCRSIKEFHITDALDQCADLLEHHGGHAAAAGFTVRNERLPELLERLRAIAEEKLSNQELRPTLNADVELPLSDLKPELISLLKYLEPTGQENNAAVFVSRDLRVVNHRTVGRNASHLKLTVSDGDIYYDAIAFGKGYWEEQMPSRLDLMYHFEVNEYNGNSSLQLRVVDLKPAGTPDN